MEATAMVDEIFKTKTAPAKRYYDGQWRDPEFLKRQWHWAKTFADNGGAIYCQGVDDCHPAIDTLEIKTGGAT
jgi:hypothetical protein